MRLLAFFHPRTAHDFSEDKRDHNSLHPGVRVVFKRLFPKKVTLPQGTTQNTFSLAKRPTTRLQELTQQRTGLNPTHALVRKRPGNDKAFVTPVRPSAVLVCETLPKETQKVTRRLPCAMGMGL